MTTPKVESFKEWLEAKPYWEQYLWQLHTTKETLDEADIEKCYEYLMEDSGVAQVLPGRAPISFSIPDFGDADVSRVKITLDKIEGLKNVNALDDECVVEFGKNLTIIYGDNGSGKSGIGRLLSNACFSRKPRKLLPNARVVSHQATKITADFHVSNTTGSDIIHYALGETNEALRSFSVFDHECALIHLDSGNKVKFVPSKIKIFDEVFKSISTIEEKLREEGEAKIEDNPTEGIFSGTSPITEFLDSLSYTTTNREIDFALKFTSSDKALLTKKKKEIAEKLKQDVSRQKRDLSDECDDLNAFKNALSDQGDILTRAKAAGINALIKEIGEKKDIANKLSVKNFDFAAFKNVGSAEWKSLIAAARRLHEKETISNNGVEPGHCLLCRRALTAKEKTLFGDYWKFLRSTAETELATARGYLAASLDELETGIINWPIFSQTEVAVKIIKKNAPGDLKTIKAGFDRLKIQSLAWIGRIKKEQVVTYADPKIDLASITGLIKRKEKLQAKLVDPSQTIRTLNGEITCLEQKKQASAMLAKIKKYTAWLRWENATRTINLHTVRGNITRKKTEIMSEVVIAQYVEIFNEETEELECKFGLRVEPHGHDVATVKELRLDFAPGYNPSDILSEGEQTVSALADFLTEARLDKNNSGIIFDDPVNSLDHLRKDLIARRLAKESANRQVVVLTHDISFLLDLQFYAGSNSIDCTVASIRKNGDRIGVVKKELPWFALNVKSRVGQLKNELVRLKSLEAGDQDVYRKEVKGWYEFLREAWEGAVEERLFNGVVRRFNHAVQTQRLNKLVITKELIKEVNDGMTESSKWLHDTPKEINPAVPKSGKLEADLKLLDDFIAKCLPS